jgi:SAM-dependent methyltransferase
MASEWPVDPNDFETYYAFAPAALALRECARLAAVRELDLPEPILDVGCGDGVFARLAYPTRQIWGIDINPMEVSRAQATASYKTLICGSICDVDLPQRHFHSAIANCSLEHVPDIHGALANIQGALADDALFVLIVPTPDWTQHLAVARLLGKLGLGPLARSYGAALDRLFFHLHLVDDKTWTEYLERAGFEVQEVRRIVSPAVAWAFDAMLYPSTLGYAVKKLTGRWVLAPALRGLTAGLARRALTAVGNLAPQDANAAPGEYVILARPKRQKAS